jgi:precorrin-6B methylase 2
MLSSVPGSALSFPDVRLDPSLRLARDRNMWSDRASPLKLAREAELLLACARTRLEEDGVEHARGLAQGPLDWIRLLEMGARHGVVALLYSQLNAVCPEAIPPEWAQPLRESFKNSARRNVLLASQLFRILDDFAAEGILAIPYKGPALAAQAYGNLALRRFVDLDIAVRHRDVARASELLRAEGYRAEWDPSQARNGSAAQIPGQYFFEHTEDDSIVELHTERTLRYFPVPLDLDELAGHLATVRIGGREIRTLAIEDSLTILSVHASKHFWERLMWVCDVAELLRTPRGVDWQRAEAGARRLRAERMFYLGLCLAHELLDAPLPNEVRERANSIPAVRKMAKQVRQRMFEESRVEPGMVERLVTRWRMRGGLWSGAGYSLRLATAPTEADWSTARLRGPLTSAYRLLRPLRLLRTYGLVGRAEPSLAAYAPTPPSVAERMLELAELQSRDVLYDLGCGDGRIVIQAAERYGVRAVGVDIDPRRIAEARRNARKRGMENCVTFLCEDAFATDLSKATVVTLYLTAFGTYKLQAKLQKELPDGARVVSRDVEMLAWSAEKMQAYHGPEGERGTMCRWRVSRKPSAPTDDPEPARAAETLRSY